MRIDRIIVHCSDSLWGCAREIDRWHKERGWSGIGYHAVIGNGLPTFANMQNAHRVPSLDGAIECGRYLDDDPFISVSEAGAHALGYNDRSVGICLIGVDQFTSRQMLSLLRLCTDLTRVYSIPNDWVIGHSETESGAAQGKTCPNIDMRKFRSDLAAWKKVEEFTGGLIPA